MQPPSSKNPGNDPPEHEWLHPIFEDTTHYENGHSTNGHHSQSTNIASPFAADVDDNGVADKDEADLPWNAPRDTTRSIASAAPSADAQAAAPVPKPSPLRSAFWALTAIVVGVLAIVFLFNELTTASSMQGASVGNLINLRAIAPGVVSEVLIDEADEIEPGQIIARLDSAGLDTQLQKVEELLNLKRLEASQVASAIDEEKRRLELLHEISQRSETMLGMEIEELDIQLDLASELASELKGSVNRGSAKKFEFLEAESNRLRIAKRLEEKHGELDLQKLITENAAEGRHYHAGVVRSWLDELQLHGAKVATEIGQTELEAAAMRTEVDLSTISAQRAGRVFAVHHHPGSSVQAGDSLVTLETDNRAWIIASFKYAEAEDIAYGDRATVDFPALDESITGTVVAIGHSVISATDAYSPFLRLTPEEVLVKIEPDTSVDRLHSGISAQVSIRTTNLNPVSWLISLFKHSATQQSDDSGVPKEEPLNPAKPEPSDSPVPSPAADENLAPMNSPFDFSQK